MFVETDVSIWTGYLCSGLISEIKEAPAVKSVEPKYRIVREPVTGHPEFLSAEVSFYGFIYLCVFISSQYLHGHSNVSIVCIY